MRYISLFSGIEAASVAWEPLGWEPLAFCEIDEFPSAVLAHRFPDVENLGDITKVDWKEVIARHGRPDVVVGGSPCQSFSVAGGRESLSGESRLMFEYVRALDEIRPRWFLWENVPGVLNTRDNAFAQLLGEVQKLGYGSLAWRVLDAQFFGVAQRRRRVFLVGRLGEGGSAAAVLFEPESLRWDTPSSREKRKALAAYAGSGAQGPDGRRGGAVAFAQNTRDEVRVQGDGTISGALAAQPGMKQQTYVSFSIPSAAIGAPNSGTNAQMAVEEMVPTIKADGKAHAVAEPIVMASAHYNAEIGVGGVTPTLIAHIAKDAPVLATAMTCSHPSVPQTAASSSSTTNLSEADGFCSTQDGSGPDHAEMRGHSVRCVSSNGDDVIGALCARDYKGVGTQYVSEGKVIAHECIRLLPGGLDNGDSDDQ